MTGRSIRSEQGLRAVDLVRSLCSRLPEVAEAVDAFGHLSFRVSDRPFVIIGEGPEGVSVAVKTDPSTQDALLRLEGHRYFRTPYIGQHGWVSQFAETGLDREVLGELVKDAYERVAPQALVRKSRED